MIDREALLLELFGPIYVQLGNKQTFTGTHRLKGKTI